MLLHLQRTDLFVLGLCLVVHYYYRSRRRNQLPFPPGPKRWPVIGNALSIPTSYMFEYYDALAKELNTNVLYLEAFGQPIVVLSDLKAVQDLLDKRSAIYSSRPHVPMIHDLVDLNHFFAFLPYGDLWRDQRKLFLRYFSPKNMPIVEERVEDFVRKSFLPNMLRSPQKYHANLHECFGGAAMSLAYGIPIKPRDDPWVRMVEECFTISSGLGQTGKYLVDILPWLKYVPSWMPGAKFKRDAIMWKPLMKEAIFKPFEEAGKAMLDGTAKPSFVSAAMAQYDESTGDAYQLKLIRETASIVYTAGSETIVASILTFILAMLKFPEVQRRAQEELDSVVGNDRLPEYSDVRQLPYVSAVLKEAMRWHSITPNAVPHTLSEDNIYEGYLIPKGSVVIGSPFSILKDENYFPNPHELIPERFLRDGKLVTSENDPEDMAVFGFGRRVCPGSSIGLLGYHLTAICLLSLFDISPEIGTNGEPVDVPLRFTGNSGASIPEPFPCKITPRLGRNVDRLLQEFMEVEMI